MLYQIFKTYMAVQILVIQPNLNLSIVKALNLLQPDRYLVRSVNYFGINIWTNPGHEVVMI